MLKECLCYRFPSFEEYQKKVNADRFSLLIGKWLSKQPFDYDLAKKIDKNYLSKDAHEAYVMLMGASDPASEHLRPLILAVLF